jgi:Uma2 family endonuclease
MEFSDMWGLEYALLFGWDKLELVKGKTRCAFPFSTRELAELHFTDWWETLCHWKGWNVPLPNLMATKNYRVESAGFEIEIFPRPIELRIPLHTEPYLDFERYFWQRDFWESQPSGKETGWDFWAQHSDITMNLFSLFETIRKQYGGQHIGRVPIALSETAAVAPDHYYFGKERKECLIKNNYFYGVPDLIAEVLSPASRAIDRGPRKELYRRVGVPHLWLLEPELNTIEVYELAGKDYKQTATYESEDAFRPALFPEITVEVKDLFETQWTRRPLKPAASAPEPIPDWLFPAELPLGLEYLFLLGHPERRSEIWNNRAPCMLPFGSSQEAHFRFEHFLEETCHWEQKSRPGSALPDIDVEQAEVGRFQLTRKGRVVHLHVAVDARKFRQLLEVCADRQAWDWGE